MVELAPASRLDLTVDGDLLAVEQVTCFPAGVHDVRQFQQLAEADHVSPDWYLAAFRHMRG